MKHIYTQAYEKLRPYILWGLVLVAVVGKLFKFEVLSNASLIAALFIIISILLDIYRQTSPPDDGTVTFERFDGAAVDLRMRLSDQQNTTSPVSIKWIGMAMEYGTPVLIDVISEFENNRNIQQFSAEVVMLDPDWEGASQLNSLWPEQISASASQLKSTLHGANCQLWFYSEAPGTHGFLLNDRYLYISRCTWRDLGGESRLFGGENSYQFFDIQQRGEPASEGRNFLGWLKYLQQRKVDLEGGDKSDLP